MKFQISQYAPSLAALARRAAVAASLSLLGLGAALAPAWAQTPNDITQATPYSWPMFHAGGTSPGTLQSSVGLTPSPNLLMGQLQGTPSGVYTNTTTGTQMLTETPSFLLGNYQPSVPPGSTAFSPNNFRDALPFRVLSWSAPFTFTIPASALTDPNALQVDDTTDGTTPNPAVTVTPAGSWQNAGVPFLDGTATNGEYLRHTVVQSPVAANATVTWTLTAPPNGAGFYAVTFHIPDAPLNNTEPRIQDAHYTVTPNGQATVSVNVSQTDANASQVLAGPFFLAAGQTVKVVLDNTTKEDTTTTTKYVVADSVTLQPGFGADTQSQPTAVNATQYPEIKAALYYGVTAGANANLATTPTAASAPDASPRGNPDMTKGDNTDSTHRIRQLVYFGRSENIVLQNSNGDLVGDNGSTTDANGSTITTPITRTVGAIYCVDGFTGSVVWRYQTPVVQSFNPDGSLRTFAASAPVFSAPAVARINVKFVNPATGAPTYATKLVVIVGDDNGLVYCLDAVGNRNGTSNSASVSANGQPIFSPRSDLGDVSGSATSPKPHAGTTPVYWIYRPDPAKIIRDGQLVTDPNPALPARDLPIPKAFGPASPTVYVNPASSVSRNAVGSPPGNVGSSTVLPSNATVYIGNSNGTLYSLDALGGLDPDQANFNVPRPILELGPLGAFAGSPSVPTCAVNWWFATNGTATNTTDDNNGAIVSAPAIWETDGATPTSATTAKTVISPSVPGDPTTTPPTLPIPGKPQRIYFTTANDPLNEGRLYSILSTGPTDQSAAPIAPGAVDYNVISEPYWAFPRLQHQSVDGATSTGLTRPALGSMSGSPVVFLNPHDVSAFPTPPAVAQPALPTIYVAAASGVEEPGQDRPGVEESGRIWAVSADGGTLNWAYPTANDPNNAALDTAAQPAPPVGTFRNVTPAIGMVQFPSTITYPGGTYTHSDRLGDVKGRVVPMLYAGSAGVGAGQLGPRFYGLDLDVTVTGNASNDDNQRTIFKDVFDNTNPEDPANYVPGIPSPGDAFQTSPALVVNSSAIRDATTGAITFGTGSGGALFVAAGSTLYQISATPESTQDATSAQPIFPTFTLHAGFGAVTSPSVAGADVADQETVAAGGSPVPQTTDWVYFGDRGLGITFGITPQDQGNGVGQSLVNNIVPPNPVRPRPVLSQFPLYTYLFDGLTTAHPGGKDVPPPATTDDARDMRKANQILGPLPIFEWGQNVYIRIGNVIPPPVVGGTPLGRAYDLATDPLPDNIIPDPDHADVFFTDGGPITIQISEFDPLSRQANQTDTGQVPATILTDLPGNGFIRRSDPYADGHFIAGPPPHTNERLIDATGGTTLGNGKGWIGAYTYAIRDGSGRKNTPGSTRRVINATQTATAYELVPDPNTGVVTPQKRGTVTLTTTVTTGNQFARTVIRDAGGATTGGTLGTISAVDQPTFALLNPLAAHGGGVPLFAGSGAPKQIGDVVGPFAGVNPAGSASPDDLPAYTNGNRTYPTINDIPTSGVRANRRRNSRLVYHRITTAVGEINHGTTGDNASPVGGQAPVGFKGNGNGTGGLSDVNAFGTYMLNIGDRSILGLNGQHLQVTMEAHNAHWNDNTGAGGPGAVVNPLPWERMPAQIGPNTTPDYPNIPRRNVTHVVQPNDPNNAGGGIGGPATNQAVVPDGATPGTGDASTRKVYADPVQVRIDVPRFQPANLQLWDAQTGGGITPENANKNNLTYPMGYVSRRQRVYVDSNHNGQYDEGEAYRYLFTYVGVPVDMNTVIDNSTIDFGKLPQSFGVQTEANTAQLGLFLPYNPNFRNFFKPVRIFNRGNVNLLNVHLDQKLNRSRPDTNNVSTLDLMADTLDSLVSIPAFDLRGVTGPRAATLLGKTAVEAPYLLRSSLDSDLVTAYGRNPGLDPIVYQGATFHKALVGNSAQGSLLTVPDKPSNNTPALAGTGYNLLGADISKVDVDNSGRLIYSDPNNPADPNTGKFIYTSPYIGLAIPLGTPVGTYSQRVQLFEGIKPTGYTDIGQGTTYSPLLPPQYTGWTDVWNLPNGVPLQPGSTPVTVKATVTETRITDGFTFGNLAQIDPTKADADPNKPISPSNGKGVADFQPSAFRNLFWNGSTVSGDGSLGLVWTTSRGFTSATAPQYNIAGALLSYQGGYFNSTPNNFTDPMSRWWKLPSSDPQGLLFTNTASASGVNTGMTFVKDQHLPSGNGFTSDGKTYAFVQNVLPSAGNRSQIICYPVGTNGVVDTTPANASLVTSDPGPAKSGVHGLKFSNVTVKDAFDDTFPAIKDNLWAFWGGGARGRSAISFSSADTTAAGTGRLTFGKSAVLPIPAGLVSVSDPNAVLISVPQGNTTKPIPAIEVTYTGVSPDNNADIYVSRYLPYYVRNAQNQRTDQIGLALVPSPKINEQLQVGAGNLYWQARDVGWLRSGDLNVTVGGGPNSSLLLDPGNGNLRTGVKQTFDRATGSLVYTNVAIPVANSATVNSTVYLDLARGRVRFSPALTGTPAVYATFYSQARRITTDTRADTVPIAFLDPTYKPNEAPGTNDRIQTDRYWFIWRKSGSSGTSTTPTLFYKTQRLTLVLHDNANNPISLQMGAKTGLPTSLTITDVNGGPAVANTDVDIDWARGRLYFPMLLKGTTTTEGRTYQITFTASDGKTYTVTDTLKWLDEPRNNDLQNQPINAGPVSAAATNETALPIDTIVNESNVSAFLDPLAYANVQGGAYDPTGRRRGLANLDQPHKIWLFWNSTRNGTADLYYETILPRFSASVTP